MEGLAFLLNFFIVFDGFIMIPAILDLNVRAVVLERFVLVSHPATIRCDYFVNAENGSSVSGSDLKLTCLQITDLHGKVYVKHSVVQNKVIIDPDSLSPRYHYKPQNHSFTISVYRNDDPRELQCILHFTYIGKELRRKGIVDLEPKELDGLYEGDVLIAHCEADVRFTDGFILQWRIYIDGNEEILVSGDKRIKEKIIGQGQGFKKVNSTLTLMMWASPQLIVISVACHITNPNAIQSGFSLKRDECHRDTGRGPCIESRPVLLRSTRTAKAKGLSKASSHNRQQTSRNTILLLLINKWLRVSLAQ